MIIDDTNKELIEKAFRLVYDLKDEAKTANSTATEKLNELAQVLSPNKDKYSIKRYKSVVKKAFKNWVELHKGDSSSEEAVEVANSIVGDRSE